MLSQFKQTLKKSDEKKSDEEKELSPEQLNVLFKALELKRKKSLHQTQVLKNLNIDALDELTFKPLPPSAMKKQ